MHSLLPFIVTDIDEPMALMLAKMRRTGVRGSERADMHKESDPLTSTSGARGWPKCCS